MKQVLKVIAIIGLPVLLFCIYAFNFPGPGKKSPPISADHPKIQVAILLDVSNSMDGLIGQAKAQLWNMVGVLGKAKCNNAQPQIEIALYEYGRETNDPNNGYVKQISPFTSDLDKLSQQLFSLTTNGGDEYCGHVIFNSINELSWDPSPTSYKVIFISGNEDFLQGDVVYTRACDAAKKKGVIVNTIYCGDRMQGIQEHWNLNAECGNGSFSTINQDVKLEEIPTPYDSTIIALNDKLNKTYMSYGYDQMLAGKGSGMLMQIVADSLNLSMNKSVAIQRAGIKSNAKLYNNSTWDMVDAAASDSNFVANVDLKSLPVNLRGKSRKELQQMVKANAAERGKIQSQIQTANSRRNVYIAENKAHAGNNNNATLETQIEKIVKDQVKRYNMQIP